MFALLHPGQLSCDSAVKLVPKTIVNLFLTAFATIFRPHHECNYSVYTAFICEICGCAGESRKVAKSLVHFVDVSANPRCL